MRSSAGDSNADGFLPSDVAELASRLDSQRELNWAETFEACARQAELAEELTYADPLGDAVVFGADSGFRLVAGSVAPSSAAQVMEAVRSPLRYVWLTGLMFATGGVIVLFAERDAEGHTALLSLPASMVHAYRS